MSNFSNFFIKSFGIGLLLLFGTLSFIDLKHGLIRFDWTPYKTFFSNSKNIGTWIDIQRGPGYYSNDLDKKWVISIFNSLNVKIKWKESSSNDKLDMIYEVKAKLTHPIFSEKKKGKIDYQVNITFKFIDEEGFIIESIRMPWSEYDHEEFERTSLYHGWSAPESENIVIKGQKNDIITKDIKKRIVKITYHPEITVTDWEEIKRRLR